MYTCFVYEKYIINVFIVYSNPINVNYFLMNYKLFTIIEKKSLEIVWQGDLKGILNTFKSRLII